MEQRRTCQCCGKPLVRKRFPSGRLESNSAFLRRKYCSMSCANTRRPESRELRKQMVEKSKTTVPAADKPRLTAKEFLESVINNDNEDTTTKINAARVLIPYQSKKAGEKVLGKKEEKAAAAKEASTGRFAPMSPPKIININSRLKEGD